MSSAPPIVTPAWLFENLKSVKVVDSSWYVPMEKRSQVKPEFIRCRIPGAVFFHIDEICDRNTHLPHNLPTPAEFEKAVGELGIKETDHVITYDQEGKYVASARVWWTFRVFGHKNISVLEGGLPAWLANSFPIESGERAPPIPAKYIHSHFHKELVRNLEDVTKNLETQEFEVVDARPRDRWLGKQPEPRPGLLQGQIPHSKSVPAFEVQRDGKIFEKEELLEKLKSSGVNLDKPIVTSCGSGVTAAIVSLALYARLGKDTSLYDGSFAEWGDPKNNKPVLQV
eukprot:TRINITY_DN1424_c0_g1_i4.p1 TRINITY_DN1424_c0_g1~~TRINITY_DN1424_c0_g1_i4.p1  ORF type:complete len:284 (+),score=48.80 TRINITY_DN1424_c0_g1_i4:121-972(+)